MCLVVGALGLACAGFAAPQVLRAAPFEVLASRLVLREPFRPEALRALRDRADGYPLESVCDVRALKGVTLLRALIAEGGLSSGAEDADGQLNALQSAATAFLRCSPTQGGAWFALYWVELNRFGPTPQALSFLDMSYNTAPREGWIALMRNEVAVRVLGAVSAATGAAILAEWRDLVRAGIYDQAARILIRADAARRQQLLSTLSDLPPETLRWLSVRLARLGADFTVPTLLEVVPSPRDSYRPFITN